MSNSNIKANKKEINKKKAAIISDYKNANLLLDILNFNQSEAYQVVCASCRALGEIFAHFLSKKQLNNGKNNSAEEDLSKEDQFSSWLREQFTMSCDILCDNLNNEKAKIQNAALEALVTILQGEKQKTVQGVCGKLVQSIIRQLLDKDQIQTKLPQILPVVLTAWEDTSEISSCSLTYIKTVLKSSDTSYTDAFLFNCWRVIKQIADQEIDDKAKKLLTAVVCLFLKNKMPTSLYREILTGISTIMEKMSTPIRLADFLSESFNIGGAISLMSLHGLFILMNKYNLEYPEFYKKLYSMFEPQVFGAKYRARFFHLADIFLSSTHLPSYLVAAFAKRLARLCLHAPATSLHIAVPFILNLISRHPACEVLLHKTSDSGVLEDDPFLAEEEDMSKCRALDSCLWELQTLEQHFDPTLSQKAKKRKIVEEDISQLLETTVADLIEAEIKKCKPEPTVTFMKTSSLSMPDGFCL